MSPKRSRTVATLAAGLLAVLALGCSSATSTDSATITGAPADGRPVIVVTYPVLGAVVTELVGDSAQVEVIMPAGVDPHDYRPSASDAEKIAQADLVVVNGLDLEEGLTGPVGQAAESGVPVFVATDHIAVRSIGAHEDEETHEDEHDHGGVDPHFWVDPLAVRDALGALAVVLHADLGLDLSARATELEGRLTALDAEVGQQLAAIPTDRRLLVTAHESMGYFADRYGLTLVGALVPSLTSQASPSASDLAELATQIEHHHVSVIFLEIGTPPALAEAIAEQTGARVVELGTHTLPDSGSYFDFIGQIAERVREGLAS